MTETAKIIGATTVPVAAAVAAPTTTTTTSIEDLYKAFGELADAKENAGKVCLSLYILAFFSGS